MAEIPILKNSQEIIIQSITTNVVSHRNYKRSLPVMSNPFTDGDVSLSSLDNR